MRPGHSWCCWLPNELCCPRPGPGGCAQFLNSDCGTGASAFGTGSGSLNGDRISGLVGKSSRYRALVMVSAAAANTPLGDIRPREARYGRPSPWATASATPAPPAAPSRRTVRRETPSDRADSSNTTIAPHPLHERASSLLRRPSAGRRRETRQVATNDPRRPRGRHPHVDRRDGASTPSTETAGCRPLGATRSARTSRALTTSGRAHVVGHRPHTPARLADQSCAQPPRVCVVPHPQVPHVRTVTRWAPSSVRVIGT